MADPWPWLAVAGLGALHGLNPATGWVFAAASGLRSRGRWQLLRALGPIAIGHIASVAAVAGVVASGLAMTRTALLVVATALLIAAVWFHVSGRRPAGRVGLALWSFMMSTAHGAGLMLVPALIPLCSADGPARAITASGSMLLALAAVGVHTAAMLAVVGGVASGVCRGLQALGRCGRGESPTMQRCEPRNALRRPASRPPISAPPSACSPPA